MAALKYMDSTGLAYLWNKIKKYVGDGVGSIFAFKKVSGVDSNGTATQAVAASNLEEIVFTNDSSGKSKLVLSQETTGSGDNQVTRAKVTLNSPSKLSEFEADTNSQHFTNTEKTKLSGIASGAEVNQNAFSVVKAGSTRITAGAKSDTFELAAGDGVTITPDATGKKVTIASDLRGSDVVKVVSDGISQYIWLGTMQTDGCGWIAGIAPSSRPDVLYSCGSYAAQNTDALLPTMKAMCAYVADYVGRNDTDTKNTTGATPDASKLYLVGAKDQSANPETFSQSKVFAQGGKLYSNADEVVNLSCAQTLSNKTLNINNVKVSATPAASSNDNTLATTAYVTSAVAAAAAGAQHFKGVLSDGQFVAMSTYKSGWYWVVSAAGSFGDLGTLQAGDMIYAIHDNTTGAAGSHVEHFAVVQTDMSPMSSTDIDAVTDQTPNSAS